MCGMRNETVQKRLLTKEDLTFAKALELAETEERASKDAEQLHSRAQQEVHRVRQFCPALRPEGKDKGPANCYRCGGKHEQHVCKFRFETCRYCKKKGHIVRVCRRKQADTEGGEGDSQGEDDSYQAGWKPVHEIRAMKQWKKQSPMFVKIKVEGVPIQMELDTGAAVSILPLRMYKEKFRHILLNETAAKLKTYTGERVQPQGQLAVKVEKDKVVQYLTFIVVDEPGPPLLGRDWLSKIPINWNTIKLIGTEQQSKDRQNCQLEALLLKCTKTQNQKLGAVKGMKARLPLQEGATPVFVKARPVPYSLKDKVAKELDRLEREGIITPVASSEWATTIVIVPKKDGSIRICGDFRTTVNKAIKVDKYPLPKVDDIGGSTIFSKIDLLQAYLQMELDEGARELCTINTHKGLYRYNRLPFGVSSAPAIWQRAMEQVLQGVPKTQCLLDDIIVAGATEEHFRIIAEVLGKLDQHGMTVNKAKCAFFKPQIGFCGHLIDANGLHKSQEKIKAVSDAPTPQNVSQLRAFLGLVNYYNRFLPNLSSVLALLHQLLRKQTRWNWTGDCSMALKKVKSLIASELVLTHFTPDRPVSPAQLLMKRDLRSVLHLMRPDVRDNVFKNQSAQVNSRAAAVERNFGVGDAVMVRNYRPKHPRWQPAVVHAREGPKSYQVTFRPDGACS